MDFQEMLSLLRVEKQANSSGWYACRCPAHDDGTASLRVKAGDVKTLIQCRAGCDEESILRALGLNGQDLFYKPYTPSGKPKTPAPKAPVPQTPAPKAPVPKAAKDGELGKLTQTYKYTDVKGRELFQVLRFERVDENGKRSKTFRQRHYDPKHPDAKPDGWVWKMDGVEYVLYNLPKVAEGIAKRLAIYLVEGEKDADTLTRLGLVATTNPLGASKTGETKWRDEYTRQLAGARIVILPDNDDTGRRDREMVAKRLLTTADSIKVVNLWEGWKDMPPKGDITDMVEKLGDAAAMKLLRELEERTAAMEKPSREYQDTVSAICNVQGYTVSEGCICQVKGTGSIKQLCTFVAAPSLIVTRDDGVTETSMMEIEGWTRNGRRLKNARVTMEQFKRMNWVEEAWDTRANVMPGNVLRDHLRYCMSEAGDHRVRRVREYTHTGWRKLDGKWVYLYEGGAIGGEGITVDLGAALRAYDMHGDSGTGEDELAEVAIIQDVLNGRIIWPMVAFAFLAPLRDALERAGYPPAFAMFLDGTSGTHKSTISALMLNYFGKFTETSLPASFNDTANYIRRKAFVLKDSLLVVDDFHPVSSMQQRHKMEETAQALSRAFGDNAQRGRMTADRTLAEAMPPRALAMITGEYVPGIGESGQARFYTIHLRRGDIEGDELLTHIQRLAAEGYMARLMRKYIEWLIPQMDQLPERLSEEFRTQRSMIQQNLEGAAHSRSAGICAWLMIGAKMYLQFLLDSGVVEDPDGSWLAQETLAAMEAIAENTKQQIEDARSEKPERMFLDIICEMVESRQATMVDLDAEEDKSPARDHVGWKDADFYYLLPKVAYRAVSDFLSRSGQAFPLSERGLWKQMKESKCLIPNARGVATRQKRIGQMKPSVLYIPRAMVEAGYENPRVQQVKMDQVNNGFVEINDDDVPFK